MVFFFSGERERFSLPDGKTKKPLNFERYTKHIIISVSDMPVIHFEYTQFYYPGDMDFPGENQSLDPSTQPKVFDL